MANTFKTKPTFVFNGAIKEFKRATNKEGQELDQYSLVLEDKGLQSTVEIKIWKGNVAKYWNTTENRMIDITGNVAEEVANIRKNAKGNVISYKIKGNKEMEVFTNDELISVISKIKVGTKVRVEGTVTFREYKGRATRNYSISSITMLTKASDEGFKIQTPIVITKETLQALQYTSHNQIIDTLIECSKLEDKAGKGYRASRLALDYKVAFGGVIANLEDGIGKLNNILNKTVKENLQDSEYYILNVQAKLKSGVITRKQTAEDLNPLELQILKLRGEEFLKAKIDSLEEITERFDDLILDTLEFINGKFAEPIKRESLNLPCDTSSNIQVSSNPILDILAKATTKPTEEDADDIFGSSETVENKVEEVKQEVKVENTEVKLDDLETLVGKIEEEQVNEVITEDDEFPFN